LVLDREVGRSLKVYLLPSLIEQARALGSGNVSLGLARALLAASALEAGSLSMAQS
jgi:hypothetical protein